MWLPDRTRLLKVRLHNQGEDPEGVWAEDLGVSPLNSAARYVRIGNVPVFHAKPTYGDVIEVRPDEDGMLEWDREGIEFDRIGTRILEDGGRWVAIIDYWPSRSDGTLESTYRHLDAAGEAIDIALEGITTREGRGCAYLAVPGSIDLPKLLTWLDSQKERLGFELRHPDIDPD